VIQQRAEQAIAQIPASIATLPRTLIRLAPGGLVGIPAIRSMGSQPVVVTDTEPIAPELTPLPSLGSLVDLLAENGQGVILTMGKGGVGKTTVAAAIAIALADRGFPVQLSTTDPAAHVAATLNGEVTDFIQ
jgi:arsenite-transporting ATPase